MSFEIEKNAGYHWAVSTTIITSEQNTSALTPIVIRERAENTGSSGNGSPEQTGHTLLSCQSGSRDYTPSHFNSHTQTHTHLGD